MIKLLSVAAVAAGSLLAGGAAQAHEYGYGESNLPAPAYAYDSRAYTVYERPAHKGFPLVGADAGVTVLGVHLGGSAKIRLGLDEELQHRRRVYVSRTEGAPPQAPMYRRHHEEAPPCPEWEERGRW